MPQITNNLAFVEIGSPHILSNSKIAHANRVLSSIGNSISEFRFIQNNSKIIQKTLKSLADDFSIVLISGSFGIQNGDIIANIITKIFNTELEINKEAKKIYFTYLKERNIEYNDRFAKMFILPQNSLIIPLQNNTFAFRYANFICFNETFQSMNCVLDYLKNTIKTTHKMFSMQTIANMPLEIFTQNLNILALKNNIEVRVSRENENYHIINARHENYTILTEFIQELNNMLNNTNALYRNNLLDKIHRNL